MAEKHDSCQISKAGPESKPPKEFTLRIAPQEGAPPLVRFAICPVAEGSEEFYQAEWLLNPSGNKKRDSGIDLPCPQDVHIPAGKLVKFGLGVKARAFNLFWHCAAGGQLPPVAVPTAYELRPRSSIAQVEKEATPSGSWADGDIPGRPQRVLLMPNSPGTIDVGYVGELKVQLFNAGSEDVVLQRGEAVMQIVVPSLTPVEYVRADLGTEFEKMSFPDTERGAGGFGSTGAGGQT